MAQKSNLTKKLAAYSAVASLAVATGVAHADTILFDVDPDVTLNNSNLPIDFDDDGDPEFTIFQSGTGHVFLRIDTAGADGNGQFLGFTTVYNLNTYNLPGALAAGGAINATETSWLGSFGNSLAFGSTFGAFADTGGGFGTLYVGVRFRLDGNNSDYYYGWIEVDVAGNGSSVTISRYAYNNVANDGLFAGANATAVTLQGAEAATTNNPVGLAALATAVGASLAGLWTWLRGRRTLS